ncbi:coiled-coil domain-containing protein 162-like isoform X2 [Convolutriloba macropyga]|uniref:coiled-coil domain-containing protein 162-like isoform X2 n=1 Tax=Convolutriloba macropyga TaxID=536237 RepID=UPI003F51E6EA
MEAYRVCNEFLLLWKRMEFLRMNWALNRLGSVKKLTRVSEFKEFTSLYRRDIFYPTVRTLAKKYNQLDHYLNTTISDTDPITIPRGCSEVELRLKLTVKLIDSVECRIIDAMRKKMAMEHAKLLAEKSREEGALPTDLWKKPAIKEQFTMIRPHIAEEFGEKIASMAQHSTDASVTLGREDLAKALAWLGDSLMERERQNFETYSMFYENLLKQKTRMLFKAEQEQKQLIESMKDFHRNAAVDSQCRLAEECYSLLMEVTALRCQLAEKDSEIAATEKSTRHAVRNEFMEIVHDLFKTSYTNRVEVSQYQLQFFNDASDLIQRTGDDVRRKIDDWKDKVAEAANWDRFDTELDEFNKRTLTEYRNNILDLRQQNHAMGVSMEKQKAFYKWKISTIKQELINELGDCKHDVDERRREKMSMRLMCEEELGLYRQQCVALKRSLAESENAQQKLYSMLMKEQKEKMEKEHEKQQRARSDKQMEVTRAANIENLLSKLEESENRFRASLIEKSRLDKANESLFDKSQKTIDALKKNLNAERAVKQDAISRLDDLQSVMGGVDDGFGSKSRPQTANSTKSVRFLRGPSVVSTYGVNIGLSQRVKSAGTSGRQRPLSSGYSSFVRPLTSEGNYESSRVTSGRVTNLSRPLSAVSAAASIQRPKTSSARLQQGSNAAATRIYKQLKQEEYYCDHEAMVNLNKQVAVEVQNGGGQKPHPNTRPTSAVVHMNY